MIEFTLTGDKELDRKFRDLPLKVEKKVLREALRPATKIILEGAKQAAPVGSGQLQKSLRVRAGKRTRKNVVTMQVVTGKEFFQGDTFYGAFEEFGHRIGSRSLGDQRAVYPGTHFIEHAYKSKAEEAKNDAIQRIAIGIEKAAEEHLGW